MENVFIWKWEKDLNDKKYIAIYKDNNLFGTLPNLDFTGVAKINGKYLFVETTGKFINKKSFISDFTQKTKLCEIVFYSDHSYHAEINGKSAYKLTKGAYFNEEPILTLNKDKILFPKSGTIIINTNSDIELLIYCAFFVDVESNAQ